ncbi:MAG: hypothetical protein HC862_01465 [Scytonema sp. RU_4_4]|nr:hypothetical protein [Scytonema sp. RU_4_4]
MDVSNEISIDAESGMMLPLPLLQHHYILTEIGQQQIVFPSRWVAEIMLVKRLQILTLPCYSPILLGVTHHQGDVVPLISSSIFLSENPGQPVRSAFTEVLHVVRLNRVTEKLAGVGIVVDRVIGNISETQDSAPELTRRQFQLQDIPDQVWQPQR